MQGCSLGLDVSDIFWEVSSRTENQTSRSQSLRSRLQATFSSLFPISESAIEFQMQNLYDRGLLG
jgi:hypothetical protein